MGVVPNSGRLHDVATGREQQLSGSCVYRSTPLASPRGGLGCRALEAWRGKGTGEWFRVTPRRSWRSTSCRGRVRGSSTESRPRIAFGMARVKRIPTTLMLPGSWVGGSAGFSRRCRRPWPLSWAAGLGFLNEPWIVQLCGGTFHGAGISRYNLPEEDQDPATRWIWTRSQVGQRCNTRNGVSLVLSEHITESVHRPDGGSACSGTGDGTCFELRRTGGLAGGRDEASTGLRWSNLQVHRLRPRAPAPVAQRGILFKQ